MPYKQPGFNSGVQDEWYARNPRDTSGDQEGVTYDRDGRVTSGFENFKSEAYYEHDIGKNIATDRWGKTYSPGGNVYTSDQAGYDLAQQDSMEFYDMT